MYTMIDFLSFNSYIIVSTVEAIASGVIAAIVVGPLCFICTAIIICIAIGCCVSKQRTRTVQTVTQPSVTTVASTTTTTTQHAPPQQYPSGYSGYPPPGTQNPPEYMYPDYPPQTNPAYPYPVQLQPYPTNDPYSKPQVMSILSTNNYFIYNVS